MSPDSGETWRKLVDPVHPINAIAVDPSEPRIIYFATGLCFYHSPCSGHIYRSGDGGATWAQSSDVGCVTALAVDSNQPGSLFASVTRVLNPGFGPLFSVGLRSADGGESWTEFPGSLPNDGASELLFDPVLRGVIYAVSQRSVLKSGDDGVTWIPASNGLVSHGVSRLAAARGAMPVLYAGTDAGLFQSFDGAASWSSTGFSDVVTALVANPRDPRNLFVASDRFVFESRDGGNTWTPIHDRIPSFSAYHLALDSAGVLHAGSARGVFDYRLRDPRVVSPR